MAKRRVGSQTASLIPDQKKSGIDLIYLAADDVRHSVRKILTRATTLLQTALQFEVMGLQSPGSPSCRDFGTPAGVPREKNHLDVGLVERSRVYYKGEGSGFPQVRAVVSLMCPCCSWLVLASKVFQLCTNHFVWLVCKPV